MAENTPKIEIVTEEFIRALHGRETMATRNPTDYINEAWSKLMGDRKEDPHVDGVHGQFFWEGVEYRLEIKVLSDNPHNRILRA